ncbi:MAG: helix-turn-helix transcriptional regulator [Clostridia bacterium]|nr:helix-turn-helix transcriptional regulator [Clostridia bacterium]
MDLNIKIGEKISKLRADSGISQKLLAEYLSVDQSYISKIEKGERPANLELLSNLSSLFGCTLDYFNEEATAYSPLAIAFRADSIGAEDLKTISMIQKIALNLKFMDELS